MADSPDPLASLLNIDPSTLQGLLAQFGPTPEMQKEADRQKWIATGLGILGAQPGNSWRAIGQGGLLGLSAKQQYLQEQLAQRGTALQQALQAMQAARQMDATSMGLNLVRQSIGGGGSGTPAQQPESGVPNSPALPAPSLQPSVAPSAPSSAGSIGGVAPWANPMAQMGFALAGMNKAADVAGEQMKMQIGPDGSIFRNGVPVGRATPQGMIIYRNGDLSQPQFFRNPTDADKAAAQAAGAIAQEQAKSQIIETTGPSGRVTKGFAGNLLPPLPGQSGAALGLPAGASLNLQGPVSGSDMQRALADAQGVAPSGGVTGPDPIAMKAAEANAQALAGVFGKQYEKVDADAEAAGTLRARLAQMNELLGQFSPNMAAPVRQKIAEVGQAMGLPDNIVSAAANGDLAAMQEFRKHSVQMAFEAARTQMGGVPRAWMELKTQLEANPSASLTPQANQAIMAFMDGMAQRAETKQQARDQWLQSHPTLQGFEGAFAIQYPPTRFLPDPKQFNIPAAGTATATPGGWTVRRIR